MHTKVLKYTQVVSPHKTFFFLAQMKNFIARRKGTQQPPYSGKGATLAAQQN
jgi:hypothetical protein